MQVEIPHSAIWCLIHAAYVHSKSFVTFNCKKAVVEGCLAFWLFCGNKRLDIVNTHIDEAVCPTCGYVENWYLCTSMLVYIYSLWQYWGKLPFKFSSCDGVAIVPTLTFVISRMDIKVIMIQLLNVGALIVKFCGTKHFRIRLYRQTL